MSKRIAIDFALLVAWGLIVCGAGACGEEKKSEAPQSLSKADAIYRARGTVRKILKPSDKDAKTGEAASVMIHHEALPSFKDKAGKTVGMKAMTMSFSLAPSISLKGIETGDKISFRFEVRWSGDEPPLRLIEVKKLSKDTELSY